MKNILIKIKCNDETLSHGLINESPSRGIFRKKFKGLRFQHRDLLFLRENIYKALFSSNFARGDKKFSKYSPFTFRNFIRAEYFIHEKYPLV